MANYFPSVMRAFCAVRRRVGWGGVRTGAGRKRVGPRSRVGHFTRESIDHQVPVHVTLRLRPGVWSLRSARGARVVRRAIQTCNSRGRVRVCEYAILSNHLHLIVEAQSELALSRGMQGFSVILARGLNRVMGRSGRVLADRYHAHPLRGRFAVRNALAYVRGNLNVHRLRRGLSALVGGPDPYSSDCPTVRAGLPLPSSRSLRRACAEAQAPPP